MSDLMDYDLGAPSRPSTSRKTGLDRSGFQMAAGSDSPGDFEDVSWTMWPNLRP